MLISKLNVSKILQCILYIFISVSIENKINRNAFVYNLVFKQSNDDRGRHEINHNFMVTLALSTLYDIFLKREVSPS